MLYRNVSLFKPRGNPHYILRSLRHFSKWSEKFAGYFPEGVPPHKCHWVWKLHWECWMDWPDVVQK